MVFTPTTTMADTSPGAKVQAAIKSVPGDIKHFAEKHPGITAGVGAVGGAGALAVGGLAWAAHGLDCLQRDFDVTEKDCIF